MTAAGTSGEPRVTIAVIQRDRYAGTDVAIRRIYDTVDAPFELLLVSANTPRRYLDDIRRILKRNSRVIEANRFLTANAARTIAANACRTEYFCPIENNVLVYDGWLPPLLEAADKHPGSVVTPLFYHGDRSDGRYHYDLRLDRIEEVRGGGVKGYRVADTARVNRAGFGSEAMEVDSVECHALLGRTGDLQTAGLFDPRVTHRDCYDLTLGLREAGVGMYFEPRSEMSIASYGDVESMQLEPDEMEFWFHVRGIEHAVGERDYVQGKWNITGVPSGDGLVKRWHYFIDPEVNRLWRENRLPRYYFQRVCLAPGTAIVATRKRVEARTASGGALACNPQAALVLHLCGREPLFERIVFALKGAYPEDAGNMVSDVAAIVDRFIDHGVVELRPCNTGAPQIAAAAAGAG